MDTNVSNLQTPFMGTLVSIYDQVRQEDLRSSFAQVLRATFPSFVLADREASHITQTDGRYRGMYDNKSYQLMQYDNNDDTDRDVEDLTIELIATSVNDYLSSYKEMPDQNKQKGQSQLKEIKVLFMQLIAHHAFDVTDQIFIPDYMKEYVENANQVLHDGAEEVFQMLINDFIETDNSHLIDYIQTIGWEIFGWDTNNDADTTWSKYLNPYISTINNLKVIRSRYITRRDEFSTYTRNIQYNRLYDTFGITRNTFTTMQRSLFNKFSTCYSQNTDVASIRKLIYGI